MLVADVHSDAFALPATGVHLVQLHGVQGGGSET